MKKTLLIVSGGIEALYAIKLAQKRGIRVIVSDQNPQSPGAKLADGFIQASTYDPEATVKAVIRYHQRQRKINGVMTVASDVPLTVAQVAKALDLPGNTIGTATLASDKVLMKQHFKKHGVPIPWFKPISDLIELKRIIKSHGLPLIIKPVDSRGARGVLKLNSKIDLEWALKESRAYSPTKRVMVEEYLDGQQISTESFHYDGFSITPGTADRNYEQINDFSPYMVENGGETPCSLTESQRLAVEKTAELAGSVMGITRNSSKGDMVLTKTGPKVIEIAARLSGGYYSTHSIRFQTGVNLVSVVMDVSLGKKPSFTDLISHPKCFLAQRYLFPRPGIIRSITGLSELRKNPGLKLFKLYVKPGDKINVIHNHTSRAGMILMSGKTRQQAISRVRKAIKTIKIKTSSN